MVACGYGDLEETNTGASCRSVNSCEVSSIFWCFVFETDQLHSRVDRVFETGDQPCQPRMRTVLILVLVLFLFSLYDLAGPDVSLKWLTQVHSNKKSIQDTSGRCDIPYPHKVLEFPWDD